MSRFPRLLSACLLGAVTTLGGAIPAAATPTARAVEVHTDIAYAPADPPESRGHLLDLYVPDGPGGGPRPLLVVMGGSGWLGDDGKYLAPQFAPHFTDAGYVVAGVSTRSSLQARFPAQVHDVKAAVRWLRAHAEQYGIDPDRIAVLGDSSGGWTATMAGVTGYVPELEGDVGVTGPSSAVQAVVDLYGPTAFLQMDAQMLPGACDAFNEQFGLTDCHDDPRSPESLLVGCPIQSCPDAVRAADPAAYADRGDPPVLIAHGLADALVPHGQSELLFTALDRAGVPAVLYSVPEAGHSPTIVSPDLPEARVRTTDAWHGRTGTRPTVETIERFLDRALRPGRG
ncbi:alpha/beta hydrolase fold domain-containing protein [Geodermatophilus sp. SYSU D00697]